MDLYERRELTKKVHIESKYIQRNIQASLLAQLKTHYQGKCLGEGYIHKDSFTILNYSVGRVNYLRGGVDYDVKFQADICMPHPGQIFRGMIVLRSKIGLHVELLPLKVLIPRDLHLGNELFETVEGEVEFEVVGTQFKQGDEEIVVVAKLVGSAAKKEEMVFESAPIPVTRSVSGDEMHVIVKDAPAPKRKLKQKKEE